MVLSKWWLWARIMILVHKKNHDLQYNSTLKKSRGEKLKKKRKKASSQSLKKYPGLKNPIWSWCYFCCYPHDDVLRELLCQCKWVWYQPQAYVNQLKMYWGKICPCI